MPCSQCELLERDYQQNVEHIRAVVETRYSSLEKKISDLRLWQGRRDQAIELLYLHKKTHRRDKSSEQRHVA